MRRIPRRYDIENPPEPELFRDLFPYTEVPRITFDGLIVPQALPEQIYITDTTFRDGQQARAPYTPEQIAHLFTLMSRLGGPKGIIRQAEFFLYTERDRKAVELCMERGHDFPEITGWIRANAKDFELVKTIGLRETGILTSASDYHIYRKLNKDRAQVLEDYLSVVKAALEHGIRPRCHLEDVTRASFYGFVVPFVQRLVELGEEARIPVKVRLCDTMGFGVPYPQASLPRSVPKLVYGLLTETGIASEQIEWHGHNDFHKVVVNATAAWLYGCQAVNSTCLGFGERTGNTPLEAMVMEYVSLRGTSDDMDTRTITEIAQYLKKETGVVIPENAPFVGVNFNSTAAGIHADGMHKFQEIYNVFDTDKILDRPIGITINDKSGAAGLALWMKLNLGIDIDKGDPRLKPIVKAVADEYSEGRLTTMGNEELEALARRYLPELVGTDLDELRERARHTVGRIVSYFRNMPYLRSMQPDRMETTLREIIDRYPFIQYAYVCDLTGKKITHNIVQPCYAEKYKDWAVEDFSTREWFQAPLRDGKLHVSKFYTSKLTENLCVTVSATLEDIQDQNIVGVIGVDVAFEFLLRLTGPRDAADGEEVDLTQPPSFPMTE